ncbi:hypothetical protein ACFSVK_07005 [Azorhizophilus paspali]
MSGNASGLGDRHALMGFVLLASLSGIGVGLAKVNFALYALSLQASPLEMALVAGAQTTALLLASPPCGMLVEQSGGLFQLLPLFEQPLLLILPALAIGLCMPCRLVSLNVVFMQQLVLVGEARAGWFRGSQMIGMLLGGVLLRMARGGRQSVADRPDVPDCCPVDAQGAAYLSSAPAGRRAAESGRAAPPVRTAARQLPAGVLRAGGDVLSLLHRRHHRAGRLVDWRGRRAVQRPRAGLRLRPVRSRPAARRQRPGRLLRQPAALRRRPRGPRPERPGAAAVGAGRCCSAWACCRSSLCPPMPGMARSSVMAASPAWAGLSSPGGSLAGSPLGGVLGGWLGLQPLFLLFVPLFLGFLLRPLPQHLQPALCARRISR